MHVVASYLSSPAPALPQVVPQQRGIKERDLEDAHAEQDIQKPPPERRLLRGMSLSSCSNVLLTSALERKPVNSSPVSTI